MNRFKGTIFYHPLFTFVLSFSWYDLLLYSLLTYVPTIIIIVSIKIRIGMYVKLYVKLSGNYPLRYPTITSRSHRSDS